MLGKNRTVLKFFIRHLVIVIIFALQNQTLSSDAQRRNELTYIHPTDSGSEEAGSNLKVAMNFIMHNTGWIFEREAWRRVKVAYLSAQSQAFKSRHS
jgi:hypothetical protein